MKKTAELVTTFLVILALVLSLSIPALALTGGSITVENAVAGQTYKVYRILDLETYNPTDKAYAYTINENWKDFVNQDEIKNTYLELTNDGGKTYVKWKDGANAAEFAKLAFDWAETNGVSAVKTQKIPDNTTTYTFTDLDLGYYLIDSSVGTLCALTTTKPNATIEEKNSQPTVKKQVQEDSTQNYGTNNTASIGETVNFQSEVTLGHGTENLVVHDKMEEGLTYNKGSVQVFIETKEVPAIDGGKTNFTVTEEGTVDCTFEIEFSNEYIATLKYGDILLIKYSAVLNEKAEIFGDYGDDHKYNKNDTWLTFGDKLTSEHSNTETYTYQFDLLKTDEKGNIISGAQFDLYEDETGDTAISLVDITADDAKTGVHTYRVATKAEKDTAGFKSAKIEAGFATVKGLDAEDYFLEETQQPNGYNKLAGRKEVDLTNGNIKAVTTNLFAGDSVIGRLATDANGVQVINKAGAELPTTGGFGTTLFYVIGGAMILSTGILFITKKRMDNTSDD